MDVVRIGCMNVAVPAYCGCYAPQCTRNCPRFDCTNLTCPKIYTPACATAIGSLSGTEKGMSMSYARNRSTVSRVSLAAAQGARIGGVRGAALGALYEAAGPGPNVLKIASATALGAIAFGPVGALMGAWSTANPRHIMKAGLAGAVGAKFLGPVGAALGAAFLGR